LLALHWTGLERFCQIIDLKAGAFGVADWPRSQTTFKGKVVIHIGGICVYQVKGVGFYRVQ